MAKPKRKYKGQEDRFLKRLPHTEKQRQLRLRQEITKTLLKMSVT